LVHTLKRIISKKELVGLIDKHFHSMLNQDEYEILQLEPSELITSNRLDLAVKILYLEMKMHKDVSFAKELYIQHINSFTLGSFAEPGNAKKSDVQSYLRDFDSIYGSVLTDGLNETRSLIPLSISQRITNGAHRVASAYLTNKKVPAVQLNTPDDSYDAKFFLNRGMSSKEVEVSVTKFIELADKCYIALVWPSASGHQKQLDKLIPNIIYQTRISLNFNGAHNLLSQVYFNESWLGSRDNNYPGAKNKLVECFKNFDDLRVIAFQVASLEEVLLIKDKIRSVFSIGKHSVHISDTKEEATRVARILFNENSVHFLNYGNPAKYKSTYKKLEYFKSFIQKNDISAANVVLDASTILSLYGIRESNDIDYLSEKNNIKYPDKLIEPHDDELEFHKEEKNNLIFNPELYFYYDDLKFISFQQLFKMKRNRFEVKDQNDISLMKALIDQKLFKTFMARIKQKIYFNRVRFKLILMDALRVIGLYSLIRFIYRFLLHKK